MTAGKYSNIFHAAWQETGSGCLICWRDQTGNRSSCVSPAHERRLCQLLANKCFISKFRQQGGTNSAHSLLLTHPDHHVLVRHGFCLTPRHVSRRLSLVRASKVHFPDIELVRGPVSVARVQVKRPTVLGTRKSCAKHDTKVFNVEGGSLRERIRRMGAFLQKRLAKLSETFVAFSVSARGTQEKAK